MKKRDIGISIAIIAAAVLLLCFYSRGGGRIEIDAGGALAPPAPAHPALRQDPAIFEHVLRSPW